MNCFSVICLKSVSQRDTAVSSQKRPKSVLDTDNPYQVACLLVECVQEPPNGKALEWQVDKETSKCKRRRKFQVQVHKVPPARTGKVVSISLQRHRTFLKSCIL